ncbi:uncharacterized protein TNCV_3216341 [Trichonephila clavipes]|nr:uncharacterized protein TNCV_3216341 [Trichonephila clavipes]
MPSPVQSNCDAHDTIANGQYGAVWSMGHTQQCLLVPFDTIFSRVKCQQGVHCFVCSLLETTSICAANGTKNDEQGQRVGTTMCLLTNPTSAYNSTMIGIEFGDTLCGDTVGATSACHAILRSSLLVVFLVAPGPVFRAWVPSRVHCSQQFLTAHSELSTWPATRRVDQPAVFIPMIRSLSNSLNCEKCLLARLPDMFRLPNLPTIGG